MALGAGTNPLQLLHHIEQRSQAHAQGLPQQLEVRQTWDGVGFRLGRRQLVAPLGQVQEILTCPALTPVPAAKRWVRGIANVRGLLLPIMDLQDFLEGQPTNIGPRSRVLVVAHEGVTSGLLVDAVLGQKHFLDEERAPAELEAVSERLGGCLQGAFQQGGELWQVFVLHRLLESQQFLHVAA